MAGRKDCGKAPHLHKNAAVHASAVRQNTDTKAPRSSPDIGTKQRVCLKNGQKLPLLTEHVTTGIYPPMRVTRKSAAVKKEGIERALERFRAVLEDRSLEMSKARGSIARTALAYEGHFSVDERRYEVELDEHVRELRGRCKEYRSEMRSAVRAIRGAN